MGNIRQAGFTIIETVLFLGVSSFLVVVLIASTGNTVNEQRYQDAAESFKSLLQQQYADVSSVQNSRSDNWSCGATASPTNSGSITDNRGQSQCILLGKYMRLEDDKISIYKVVAYQKAFTVPVNDIDSLKVNYTLNVSDSDVDKSTMEWGTKIAYPAKDGASNYVDAMNPRRMGILVIRSPDSGQVYTFSNKEPNVPDEDAVGPADLLSMLVPGTGIPGQGQRLICISSGGMFATNDRSVVLPAYASTSASVKLQTNDLLESSGITSLRC